MTGAARAVTTAERRARLVRRHGLAPPHRVDDVVTVARQLVALHSTDPATVFLSAAARLHDPSVVSVERALYDDRTLVRIVGMRTTVWVVADELVPVIHAACTERIAVTERKRLAGYVEAAGVARDGVRWLRRVERRTLAALEARGDALGRELTVDVPELGTRLLFGEGKTWGGEVALNSRILYLLAADERIVRGRPAGSWTSSQYRWAPAAAWLGDATEGVRLPQAEARAELARRWLGAFGPAPASDLQWWAGWTKAQTSAALKAVGAVEVTLEEHDAPGFLLAGDVGAVEAVEPSAALLPALDPTPMGWKARDWYLGPHAPLLFDRSGNIGPTVWWDGRIVGGWAQRSDGEVVWRLLEDVGAEAGRAVGGEAARVAAFLGATRVRPRFPTPLGRELQDG